MRSRISAIVFSSLYAGMMIDSLLMVMEPLLPVNGSWLPVSSSFARGGVFGRFCKIGIRSYLSVSGIDITPIAFYGSPDPLFYLDACKGKQDKDTIKHQVFPPRQ